MLCIYAPKTDQIYLFTNWIQRRRERALLFSEVLSLQPPMAWLLFTTTTTTTSVPSLKRDIGDLPACQEKRLAHSTGHGTYGAKKREPSSFFGQRGMESSSKQLQWKGYKKKPPHQSCISFSFLLQSSTQSGPTRQRTQTFLLYSGDTLVCLTFLDLE